MKTKATASFILLFAMFIMAGPTPADTVIAARAGMSFYAGQSTPAFFQVASAPGVWIGTDYNAAASAVLEMAEGMGAAAYVEVLHQYDDIYGQEEMWRVYANDASAQGIANRVWSIILWSNAPDGSGSPPDSMIINMGNSSGCVTTSPEQAGLAAKALFSHKPIAINARQTWVYDHVQNTVVQITACNIVMNN